MSHDWSKSSVSEITATVADFIKAVLNLINPSHESIDSSATDSLAEKEDHSTSPVVIAGPKRNSVAIASGLKTPSKKFKHIDDTLDEEIERNKKGVLFLLLSLCYSYLFDVKL